MNRKNILAFCTMTFPLLLSVIQPAFAVKDTCPCIVFRLDDVQSHFLSNVSAKIIDTFQEKNASLTIGIIGYNFDKNTKLVSYLKNELRPGHTPIEIANHGWKHEDFAILTKNEQVSLLDMTNQEVLKTLGQKPAVFIPPYNMFNQYTLQALKQVKMKVISSSIYADGGKYVKASGKITKNKDSFGTYHLPAMTDFQTDVGGEKIWTKIPKDKIISSIDSNIAKYGYDVVLLHPQNFAKIVNDTYIDVPDYTQINEISSLIDYAKSKDIRITSFSNIVGLENDNISKTVQEIQSLKTSDQNLKMIQVSPSMKVQNAEPLGIITIGMKYPNGDRVGYYSTSLKIYQDTNKTPYRELTSITGNPFDITSLPLYHQYKIEVYLGGILSSTDYVTLDRSQKDLDTTIANEGSIKVTAYYNDDQTPISNIHVYVTSQDNKIRNSGITDPDGQTVRFWLPSTNTDGDYYYGVKVGIDDQNSYFYSPIYLQSGESKELKIVTPWPALVENLLTLKVYNQSKILTSTDGHYAVDLFDGKRHKISESGINIHGEAYFSNLKVGKYVFKAINLDNGAELGSLDITIDGTKTNFDITMNPTKS